ncbi:inositol monophosphatase [Candidatus Dojkabacteria bacterium]|uniref:Inositol monophosphatase n=1 Tax=Candidatus Dojkabacteria bacterium TaxID=2099670 RepID=A0A955L8Q0_9BACT|nr:inositol monophosphatase [Candidatus Dojkabacteria bacterium]
MNDVFKAVACDIALYAGEIMLDNFSFQTQTDYKADNSPITIADTTINSYVINQIQEKFPEHSIYGEEQSMYVEGSEYLWVCDPIDGTIPFSRGIPTNVFSLALVKDELPILAVVYDPYTKRLYSAEKGKGAFVNNEPLHVSKKTKLDHTTIVSAPTWPNMQFPTYDLHPYIVRSGGYTLDFHSTVNAGMMVAAGKFEAMVFGGTTAHDVATVKLIVEEAGGKVTNIFGEEQSYTKVIDGAIASNGVLHDEIISIVKEQCLNV